MSRRFFVAVVTVVTLVTVGAATALWGRVEAQETRLPLRTRTLQTAPARIDRSVTNRQVSLDPCRVAAAQTTLTLAAGQATAEGTAPGSAYGSGPCGRYVADVAVSTNSTPPSDHPSSQVVPRGNGDVGRFGIDPNLASAHLNGDISEDDCWTARVDVTFYRKAAGETAFTRIGGGRLNGAYYHLCSMLNMTGHYPWNCAFPFVVSNTTKPAGCSLYPGHREADPDRWVVSDGDFQEPPRNNLPTSGTDVYRIAVSSQIAGVHQPVQFGVSH